MYMSLCFVLFCSFFMIIGFVDFIKFIIYNLFKISKKNITSSNDAEFVIRNLVNDVLWNKNPNKMIYVDNRNKETDKIINLSKNDFGFIKFIRNKNKPSIK